MRQIIAEGLKDVYFQDGGNRATGLTDVSLNGPTTSTSTTDPCW